jgi:hypothetical protein
MTDLPPALDAFMRIYVAPPPRLPPSGRAIPAHLLGQSPTVWRPTPGNTEPPF